jgi:hypothetical protein
MSTPTAIEIVREMQLWRRSEGRFADYRETGAFKALELMPYSPQQFGEALDAVLRDAERFKALERAHGISFDGDEMGWCESGWGGEFELHKGTLAELADKLRSEK